MRLDYSLIPKNYSDSKVGNLSHALNRCSVQSADFSTRFREL